MRRALPLLAFAGVAGLAGQARARVVMETPPAPPPQSTDIWRELVDPHAEEVNELTTQIQQALFAATDSGYSGGDDATPEDRHGKLAIALTQLKYARKLAPENTTVLAQLGRVADELGNTRQALEALQACLEIDGPAKVDPEVTAHIGVIHLRFGELDEAIRYLRMAQGSPGLGINGQVLIELSTALALRGEMSDAIDVLRAAALRTVDAGSEEWGVAFALAVQYDRDDERGAAFETLDKLQGLLQDNGYGNQMQSWIGSVRWVPAEDEHYYDGLLYESLGNYPEARAEWSLYAASGGAFRGRALQHVAAIDAERRNPPPKQPVKP